MPMKRMAGCFCVTARSLAAGSYADVSRKAGEGAKRIDHRPHLLLPGFIDAHVHFPQMQVIASYGAELLDWLNKYTFPEETKFLNAQHGRRIARLFLDEMVRHGTTTVAAYCSVHKQSAQAFFAEAHDRDMLTIAGKVMMDRNAPEGVLDTPQSGYDDSKALIAEWHGKGRQLYAVTPRFAITSSPEQLEMAGALMREFPDLHMQTHLSENHAEIAFTQELYPWSRDYTDVYEHYGLLGKKALFGHCIHLSEREADALSDSRLGRGVLPDLEPVPRLGPVRLPALSPARQAAADRGGHRCRRRHQLFDAADHGRGLQGDRAERREAEPLGLVLADHARQRRGAVGRRQGRHAGSRHRRRHRGAEFPRHAGHAAQDGNDRDAWPKSSFCCRRSATTARWPRSMSPESRQRAA